MPIIYKKYNDIASEFPEEVKAFGEFDTNSKYGFSYSKLCGETQKSNLDYNEELSYYFANLFKQNKKGVKKYIKLDKNVPNFIKEQAKSVIENKLQIENQKKEKHDFFGTDQDYPVLNELLSIKEVSIFVDEQANGNNLILYNPKISISNKYGILVYDIKFAIGLEGKVMLSVDEDSFSSYTIDGDKALFIGFLKDGKKAFKTKEGESFVGWNRKRKYRLTKNEIRDIVKGKIFSYTVSP